MDDDDDVDNDDDDDDTVLGHSEMEELGDKIENQTQRKEYTRFNFSS